jgi:hypothetical protein
VHDYVDVDLRMIVDVVGFPQRSKHASPKKAVASSEPYTHLIGLGDFAREGDRN